MKSIFIFLLTIIFSVGLTAQDNPFMKMAGKKYADYSRELADDYMIFASLDTVKEQEAVRQFEEVAQKSGSKEWMLYAENAEFLLERSKWFLHEKREYPVQKKLEQVFDLLEKSQKYGVPQVELQNRSDIIGVYWYIQNYELAFEQCAIQEERLDAVSSEEIPEKAIYYVQIANSHYYFKDYDKAIFYFNKALEEKTNSSNESAKQSARNGIGLSYCNNDNDLDRADSYFRAIINTKFLYIKDKYYRTAWDGIAEGNIGDNMYRRGAYNEAIPLLKSSIEKMLECDDYAYSSGSAATLADIYLKKGNKAEAKRYLDLSRQYYKKIPREGTLAQIYEVMSKHYAVAGNANLSMAYMDSTLAENKRYEKQFSAMTLLRIEQKESAQRLQELAHEKEIRKQIQFTLVILSIGFIVVVGLLWLLLMYYRKKRTAYRELVRKSQEWAQVKAETGGANQIIEPDEKEEKQDIPPDEVNMSIMKNIEQLMLDEKLYTDPLLSVDMLANKLKMKRHYVSESINRCKNINFNTYINEYRIKEAIRLLSKKDAKEFSIDRIAFDAGFNDRINFYRIFKKITGLSPTEFRKNIGKE